MRKPSDVRQFERQKFARLATLIPGKTNQRMHNRQLSMIANKARSKGFNARIVKNKHTSSVYVKPRRYNAPIPETDPNRIKTFPAALRMMSEKSRKINQLENKGMQIIPSIDEGFDLNVPGFVEGDIKAQVLNQMEEIQEFTDRNIKENYVPIMENLRLLQRQSYENQFIEDFEDGASNLSEEQWDLIQKQPQFATWFDNAINELAEEMLPDLLAEYAYINDPDRNLWGEKLLEQDFSVSQLGNYHSLMSEDGVVLRTFSDDFIEKATEEAIEKSEDIWRTNFVLNMRQLGTSEHQVVAGLMNEAFELEALNRYQLLDYRKWDGWEGVKSDYEMAIIDSVPGMIDLPLIEEIPETAIELRKDAEEKLQTFGRRLTLEKLTFDKEDLRDVLKYTGWDKPEADYSSNQITRIGTDRKEKSVIAQREDEIGKNVPDGYTFVRAHLRKLPTYNIVLKGEKEIREWNRMPIPPEYEPETAMQKKKDRKKREIVRYLLYRNRSGLGPATTEEIVAHLNDRFAQGSSQNEIANFLGKDKRFEKVGFIDTTNQRARSSMHRGMTAMPGKMGDRIRQSKWNLTDYSEVEPAFGGEM